MGLGGVFSVAALGAALLAAPVASAPADQLAAARAARDAGRFSEAEALARQGMAGSDDPVWPLTLGLVLADQKRPREALAVLQAPRQPPLPARDRALAEAYAESRGGDPWRALRLYGEIRRAEPDNAEARRAMAGLLDSLRAPFGAAALDGAPPARQAGKAAALTRWGAEVRPEAVERRFEGTDRALAAQESLLAQLAADPAADPALVRRVRLDRMVALRDRVRMAEVVAEAEALSAGGAGLPAYADHAYADALLYLRRPADALQAYERVLAADPNDIQAAYGRIFALVERERLAEAVAAADSLAASRTPFVSFRGGPATSPDPEYAYASQLAAETRLWSNDVAGGYGRLDSLADAAPASASLRRARAGGMTARGWPRAAEQEARVAASLDPDSLWTRIALADTALQRNRLPEAAERAAALQALAPENLAVQRLAREVRARRGWLFDVGFAPAFNQGGGSFALGEGYTFGARALTPFITDRLRLVALVDSAEAAPPEGRVTRHRVGGGVRLESADVEATAYASYSWGSLPQPSAGVELAWSVDDHWSFSAAAQANSIETPIRALLADISGDSVNLGARFQRDERLEISASVRLLALSDGNDRLAAGASLVQLLHAAPHVTLKGRVDLYGSRNSKPGGPYFAPEGDLSLAGGLALEHVAWRRYEKILTQAASVDVGVYDQKGFDPSWIGVLRYEHRWRHDPWTEIVYGFGFDRRVYDGVAERGFSLTLGLRQRFG
jgi:biofilm PGA synthesis protein PgaA